MDIRNQKGKRKMSNKELLIHNLFREFEKEKWKIKAQLLKKLNEVILTSKKDNYKISMVIKIEEN